MREEREEGKKGGKERGIEERREGDDNLCISVVSSIV